MPTGRVRVLALLTATAVAAAVLAAPTSARAAPSERGERAQGGAPYVVEPFAPRASDNRRLVRAWRTWRDRGLSYYVTTVRRSCECVQRPPVQTTVRGRTVTEVRYRGGRELRRHGWEMAALYRLLRRGYAEADDVSVRFRDGVPRWIYIDWDRAIADEETFLGVQAGAPIEPQERAGQAAPYAVKPFRLRASDPGRLKRAWLAWRERHPAHYATLTKLSCFCSQTRTIRTEVRGARVVSVRAVDRRRELERRGRAMPALYRLLRRAYAQADDVQVRYLRGVPRSIAIDWDEQLFDEVQYFRVRLRTLS